MEEQYNKKFLDSLSPRSAFKVGLLGGLGIMFAIGFFVMTGMMVTKGVGTKASNDADNKNVPSIPTESDITLNEVTKDDWMRGDKDAEITIVEFSDVDCPFCTRFHATMQQVLAEYDGEVNWVYRNFPLTSLHPEATKKAEAAECVGDLGGNDKFWAFIDELYTNKTALANISTVVGKVGVDVNKFQTCLDSGKFSQKVQDQTKDAVAAGGRGTPYSIIVADGQLIPINGALPFEQIAPQLDNLLK